MANSSIRDSILLRDGSQTWVYCLIGRVQKEIGNLSSRFLEAQILIRSLT
jgi:hypothetical protein